MKKINIIFYLLVLSLPSFVYARHFDGMLPIVQGATSFTSTQLSIIHHFKETYVYELGSSHGSSSFPDKIEVKSRSTSEFVVDQIFYNHLRPDSEYLLLVKNSLGQVVDERILKTLNPKKKNLRIAFASCMEDFSFLPQERMWSAVASRQPDILFFLGDNVYASILDPVDPKQIWKRYVETFHTLDFYYAFHLIPVFATWDDHDFGGDDADKDYPYILESQQIFRDFYPQQEIPGLLTHGPGVSQYLDLYNQRFIFPDDRSFRDAEDGSSLWGLDQEKWVEQLTESANKPVWLINGSQIYGKYQKGESMENDTKPQFQRLSGFLKKIKTPVIIVSGDMHASEVMKLTPDLIGQNTVEITSSSMHVLHLPGGDLAKINPRRIAGYDGDNFITADFNPMDEKPHLKLMSVNKDDDINFQLEVTITGK